MGTKTSAKASTKKTDRRERIERMRRQETVRRRLRVGLIAGITTLAVVGGLFAIWRVAQDPGDGGTSTAGSETSSDGVHGSAKYPYQVGEPGIGEPAPDFTLPASTGGEISLSDYREENVLLYFQEGLMCQPCWDQIGDLEKNQAALKKAGIDQVLSISIDPVDLTTRKLADEGSSTPGLADTDKKVSTDYDALSYGMMGGSHPGHSFILVGPDGKIRWRADYGGKPKYVMFLPTEQVLTDMRRDMKPKAS